MGSDTIKLGEPPIIQPARPPIPMIKLVLVLDPSTGKMNIHGPIHNKALCASMLFDAGKTIMDMKLQQMTVPAGNA